MINSKTILHLVAMDFVHLFKVPILHLSKNRNIIKQPPGDQGLLNKTFARGRRLINSRHYLPLAIFRVEQAVYDELPSQWVSFRCITALYFTKNSQKKSVPNIYVIESSMHKINVHQFLQKGCNV